MRRFFFVPQFPTRLRYQEWWFTEIPRRMSEHFDEVIIIGKVAIDHRSMSQVKSLGSFCPTYESLVVESLQVEEFLRHEITDNDVLFVGDISFPGIFSNALYHQPVKNAYVYCHATALNSYDYFLPIRKAKWKTELAHGYLYRKVFVASSYHASKLVRGGWRNRNLSVLRPPLPPFYTPPQEKEFDIISVARPCKQKITKILEDKIEKEFGPIVRSYDYIDPGKSSWDDYFRFVSKGKVMLITSKEETFGYQVIDSFLNRCVTVAPNKYSYRELIRRGLLYDSHEECIENVRFALENHIEIAPELMVNSVISECSNFYNNLWHVIERDCYGP